MAKRKRTNNDLQNTTQKTKEQATQTPLKIGGELRWSGRVGIYCSTSGTRRVTLVTNPLKIMNEERKVKCLRQVHHIRGHL
jgi:hypothetical protein